jgi:Tol biopolymer transport system component
MRFVKLVTGERGALKLSRKELEMGIRRYGIATAALVVSCIVASAAHATAPGVAGDIVFQRYLAPENTQGSIFTIAPDGTGEHQVTTSPPGMTDRFPDFGPYSRFIAFQRCADFCQVMRVNRDGTDLRALTAMCASGQIPPACTDDSYAAISPNGKRIAFKRVSGNIDEETGQPDHIAIWFMQSSGQAPRPVTHPAARLYEDDEPQWTPDGKRIVFVRFDVANERWAIFTVRSNGHDLRQITQWDLDAGDGPDISPDGKRVLFRFPAHHGFEGSNLATMNLDGTGFRQLTNTSPGERMLSASYSPDGTRITFARDGIAGLPDVRTMKTDGSDVQRVTSNPLWDSGPDWGAR